MSEQQPKITATLVPELERYAKFAWSCATDSKGTVPKGG